MRVHIQNKNPGDVAVDLLVVGVFKDEPLTGALKDLNTRLSGVLMSAMGKKEFTGQWREQWGTATVDLVAPQRVVAVGLGDRDLFDRRRLRLAGGLFSQVARRFRSHSIAVVVPDGLPFSHADTAELLTDGLLVGYWRFDKYSTVAAEHPLAEITLLGVGQPDGEALSGVQRGEVSARAENLVREWGMRPANKLYPEILSDEAVRQGQAHGFSVEVLDQNKLREMGMEAILGIGGGSAHPPRLVVMRYQGGGPRTLALVGKGITFDAGGISLKPPPGMEEMKFDMLGAGAVLGAMGALADLKVPINVVGIMALAQNVPSGSAILPGDVVKAFNGKTIEVTNTDAEGRVVLADAVSYAVHLGVDWIVEASTLTGAAVVVLGHEATCLVATNDSLASLVLQAAESACERVWRLPIYPEYKRLYRSNTADLKNSPGREAGTITAGMIIAEFAGSVPYAHLDIAGTAWTPKSPLNGTKSGPTGVMVRTFVQLADMLSR